MAEIYQFQAALGRRASRRMDTMLVKLKHEYLTEMGSEGGTLAGYLAWIADRIASDPELRATAIHCSDDEALGQAEPGAGERVS